MENLPTVTGMMNRSVEELERACLILIRDEQEKPSPNNALIAVWRHYGDQG